MHHESRLVDICQPSGPVQKWFGQNTRFCLCRAPQIETDMVWCAMKNEYEICRESMHSALPPIDSLGVLQGLLPELQTRDVKSKSSEDHALSEQIARPHWPSFSHRSCSMSEFSEDPKLLLSSDKTSSHLQVLVRYPLQVQTFPHDQPHSGTSPMHFQQFGRF